VFYYALTADWDAAAGGFAESSTDAETEWFKLEEWDGSCVSDVLEPCSSES
jgi:hypothetical protein